jgi:pSer/pThr/pTyr-binding forkhead associated (FHA) protein
MAELTLEWQDRAGEQQSARVSGDQPLDIGRLPENALRIDAETVSRRHAQIHWRRDGFVVADLTNGRNPVLVNDRRVVDETLLRTGDRILLGSVILRVAAISGDAPTKDETPLPAATLIPQPPAGAGPTLHLRWTLQGKTREETATAAAAVTIGRLPENVLQIDHDTVSRTHVEITARDGRFVLTDLTNGRNAVNVNQRVVAGERVLNAGDIIRLGAVTLIVTAVQRPETAGSSRSPGKALVVCPNCLREVDGSLEECPWCGTALVNAQTVI